MQKVIQWAVGISMAAVWFWGMNENKIWQICFEPFETRTVSAEIWIPNSATIVKELEPDLTQKEFVCLELFKALENKLTNVKVILSNNRIIYTGDIGEGDKRFLHPYSYVTTSKILDEKIREHSAVSYQVMDMKGKNVTFLVKKSVIGGMFVLVLFGVGFGFGLTLVGLLLYWLILGIANLIQRMFQPQNEVRN